MKAQRGMTLIELMIAMAIAGLTASMVFTMFVGQDRALRAQRGTMDVQENGRVAMELLVRDIRNAGFLTPGGSAIRIEDDCSRTTNNLGYDGEGNWTIQDASDRMAAGDILAIEDTYTAPDGTDVVINEACPNGSDRITLVTRPDLQTIGTCTAAGCLTNNSGSGTILRVPCSGTMSANTGDCQKTLDGVDKNYSPDCTHTGGPYADPKVVTVCNEEDPTQCTTITITNHKCDKQFTTDNGTKVKTVEFNLDNFAGSKWNAIGGDKNGASLTGYLFRTYQILDVDGDGSTELVYSDKIQGALTGEPTNKQPASWVVVANHIDDLQFSWAQLEAPTTFHSTSLFNFSKTCDKTDPLADPYVCLQRLFDLNGAGGSGKQPAALRVSVIARGERRDRNAADDVTQFVRGALENNDPVVQTYDPSQAGAYGCTAANYETCSGNGNAQGFSRRVYSEIVGLRNLIGFTF